MENLSLISIQIALPMLGFFVLMVLSKIEALDAHEQRYKYNIILHLGKIIGAIVALTNLYISLFMLYKFDSSVIEAQFVTESKWLPGGIANYCVGVDGLSIYFVVLTAFLTPIAIAASWNTIKYKLLQHISLLLLLESLIIGVFTSLDIFLFYIFFEAVLIPMFFMIGIWGSEDRIKAAYKFFIYTLFGSVFLLLALIYIAHSAGQTNVFGILPYTRNYKIDVQIYLWLAFFISFAVKLPMWPLHSWLPLAHVQAPTAGSVMLAGILLKIGGYGFIRFSINMLPLASLYFADFMMLLGVIAVIYTSFVALVQTNMKKMIAYSSVAHMGYVTAGIFSFNEQGMNGAIFCMISHGLVSAALFLCVGILYERLHSKEISSYGGIAHNMPKFAFHFALFVFASIGLPSTSGFIGEFLVMFGTFKFNYILGIFIALGMVIGAAYMLWLIARVMFGKMLIKKQNCKDMSVLDHIYIVPISVLIIVFGIAPNLLLNGFKGTVSHILNKQNISKYTSQLSHQEFRSVYHGPINK